MNYNSLFIIIFIFLPNEFIERVGEVSELEPSGLDLTMDSPGRLGASVDVEDWEFREG